MTKNQIIDRCAELVQDDSAPMRLMLSHFIDIVLNDIASRGLLKIFKREESTALVAGQRQYALPIDTDHVYKVFVPAWGDPQGIIRKKNEDEFLALMFADGFSAAGRPHSYNIFSQFTLRLHPIPDPENAPAVPTALQKLYIWKYADVSEIADTAEITEIKLKHIPTLIYGAYSMGAKFDSIQDGANAQVIYERGVRRIVGDANLELDRASQVPYRDLG
jgi:hypothetical protein